jgi:S1/P1 Nuclease
MLEPITIPVFPFKPEGQPLTVQIREPEPVNILTALAENERIVTGENNAERRAIALAWLFHLVGDIHEPLHTTQLSLLGTPRATEAAMKSVSG